MNGIQTTILLPAREAQQTHSTEDVQLSLTDVSVSSCARLGRGEAESGLDSITVSPLTCRTGRQTTLSRTATANQAAAWTTKRTGRPSTGPILVAMATDCHSKASIYQTQWRPDKRIEVTKQRRGGQKELGTTGEPGRRQKCNSSSEIFNPDSTGKLTEFKDYSSWIMIMVTFLK